MEVAMADGTANLALRIREAIILALIVACGVLAWRTSALAAERDHLSTQAIAQRQARASTDLTLNA
jgi:hypothetical protein